MDLSTITGAVSCTEAKVFVRQVDSIVDSKTNNLTIAKCETASLAPHTEGRKHVECK